MVTPNLLRPVLLINLYTAALNLYPKSFREDYRAQMLQVFLDNYQHKQKSTSALFLFDTLTDLGGSMSQEHFSSFLQNGRIRMALAGLFLALGLLCLRPFLTSILTDGFASLARTDEKISQLIFQDSFQHSEIIATGMLRSDDPLQVMAGAYFLSEWQSESYFGIANATAADLKTPVIQALEKSSNNSITWIAAYSICLQHPSICDAKKTLQHLQIKASENGMTWLYSASEASQRGDIEAQEIYLKKANTTLFFNDANNALNTRWYNAHIKAPYKLPWYSGFASRNLSKLETSVMAFDNYSVPGCKDSEKATASIQNSCLEIAKKIALQSTSSLSLKLRAASIAAKLGDTGSSAMLELLKEQNSGYTYYLYATGKKDNAALAKAYEKEQQYHFAVAMAAANKQEKYPYIYEF